MKKILSLILALLMSASCAATIFADDTAIADDTVAETEAYTDQYDHALAFLDAKKIMQGWDGELHPEKDVKRYEMAIFATRISTGIVDNAKWENGTIDGTEFTDLEGSGAANALGALSYANQHGIVNGYEDGTFKPDNTVTYRDALVMACRTLGYTGLEYKWGYIEKAVTLGLTAGITDVAYTDTITRGVAAQIVYNALFAKTASGKTLAQASFDFDYEWKQIIVVRDALRTYNPAEITAPAANHVGFKFVEADGTFSEETLYVDNVKAGLKFGEFYNAFIGKIGGEYVDLFKTEQIVPGALITNDGNDDTDGVHDDVAAALTGKVLVTKYNQYGKDYSYNYSLSLIGRDELILVTPGSETVVIGGYNFEQTGVYGINWKTGDIVKKTGENTYETVWYYNATHDVYFRYQDTETNLEGGIAGIEVMDAEDLAALKVAIQESYLAKADKPGYVTMTAAPTAGYLYSSLLPYDLNGDGKYDYAKYEQYAYGTYFGTGACAHGSAYYNLNGTLYYTAACPHGCSANTYYTFAEGYAPDGFTGNCVFGVNPVTKELKIIKKVVDKASTTDADTYYAFGRVNGFNVAASTIVIDGESIVWGADPSKLSGLIAGPGKTNDEIYDSLFNKYVKYTVVDGKLQAIDTQGAGDYIIVERFLGIDTDGYIVIQGYSIFGDKNLTTFRIDSFDSWKVGDAFFYEGNHNLEYYFTKGNVYRVDSFFPATKSYNVTPIGLTDANGKFTGVLGMTGTTTTFTFEDNYRVSGGAYTYMSSTDTYVIIGEKDTTFNFKPITIYTGIVPTNFANAAAEWKITGTLITTASPFIFVNVAKENVVGFNYEVKTGFIATLANRGVVSATYSCTDGNYYGATEYTVSGYDLLAGNTDIAKGYTSATAFNFKPEANAIYITIDGQIVDSKALTYAQFKDAVVAAYGDGNLATYNETIASSTYIPFTFKFENAADVTAAKLSTWMSTKPTEANKNYGSYYFKLKNPHDNLLAGINTYTVTLTDGKVSGIVAGHDTLNFTAKDYTAFCIYVKATNKVHVFFCEADATAKPAKPVTTPDANPAVLENKTQLEVVKDEAYITVTPGIVSTPVMATDPVTNEQYKASYTYTLTDLTFAWSGKDLGAMNHTTLVEKGYYFGESDACTTATWDVAVGVDAAYDTINNPVIAKNVKYYDDVVVTPYADCKVEDECDLVQKVKIDLKDDLTISADNWTAVAVEFDTHVLVDGVKTNFEVYQFTVIVKLNDGKLDVRFANGDTDALKMQFNKVYNFAENASTALPMVEVK